VATSSSPAEVPEPAIVAVLGSASIEQTDQRWQDAQALGGALAERGWTVLTGGYDGLMGAVAEGARSAGGHTVGLPMTAWEHLTPHPANAELRWSDNYAERVAQLLAADVAVALPGGVGTLAEASLIWAAAQTEPGAARLVLVGDAWQQVMDLLGRTFVIAPDDLTIPTMVDEVSDIVAAVERALVEPQTRSSARG
jgi:uncharacterized protein (TIGR00730 family)